MDKAIVNIWRYIIVGIKLANVVRVGDYVEYPYEYDFDISIHKSGFRVMKVENKQVYLISSEGTEYFTGEDPVDLIDKMTQEEEKYIVKKYADFCQFLDKGMLLEMPYKLVRMNEPYWLKTKIINSVYKVLYIGVDGYRYCDCAIDTRMLARPVIRLKANVRGVRDPDGVWKLK